MEDAFLRKFNFKKQLGQNFLRNTEAILGMIEALELDSNDIILEIGPGAGALTEFIVPNVKKLILLEIDPALAELLKEKFASYSHVEILTADVLQINIRELIHTHKINKIIGALPYNISKRIIELCCADIEIVLEAAVFMLQKEVAFNYAAKPRTNFLNQFLTIFTEVELGYTVEKSKFFPVPKVDSAAIRFTSLGRDHLVIEPELIPGYIEFLKLSFQNPRKKLINNFRRLFKNKDWETIFNSLKISKDTRAEALIQQDFLNLFSETKTVKNIKN